MTDDKTPFTKRRSLPAGDITADAHEPPQHRTEDYFKRYVPRGLIKLLGAPNIMDVDVGQHVECKVTVVFMDIRNFTSISENLSSEETFELINSFLNLAIPIIESNGGIIDKFIGDAIMAIFPDDSDKALLAVRAILTGVPELPLPAAAKDPISVGAGINTGFVMVGALGNHQRMDVTIVGDSVNLASRLESLNKTYGTSCLISEGTLNSLEMPDQFSLRMIDRIRVKGKIRPQSIYELIDVYPKEKKLRIQSKTEAFENALANFHMNNVDTAAALLHECIDVSPDDNVTQMYIGRCERYIAGGELESLSISNKEVQWSDNFSVEISEIDHQHQQLLKNVNKVFRLVSAEEKEGLPEVLDFLRDYSVEHFRTEETLMAKYGYPYLSVQKHEHERFIEYFSFIRKEIESGKHDKFYLLFKIDIFLMDWLINHTTGLDKHMGKWLQQAGYSA